MNVHSPISPNATRTMPLCSGLALDTDEVYEKRDGKTSGSDGVTWSAKNSTESVRRKRCPETSCPWYKWGRTLNAAAGEPMAAVAERAPRIEGSVKRDGCVAGERRGLE